MYDDLTKSSSSRDQLFSQKPTLAERRTLDATLQKDLAEMGLWRQGGWVKNGVVIPQSTTKERSKG